MIHWHLQKNSCFKFQLHFLNLPEILSTTLALFLHTGFVDFARILAKELLTEFIFNLFYLVEKVPFVKGKQH